MCLFPWCNHVSRNENQVIIITWLFYGFWNLTLCPVTTKQMTITFERMISVTYHTQVFGIHTIAINIKTFPCDKYHRNPTNPTYICWNPSKELFNNLKHFNESCLPHFKIEKGSSTEDSQLPKIQSLPDIEKTGGKEYWSADMRAQPTI